MDEFETVLYLHGVASVTDFIASVPKQDCQRAFENILHHTRAHAKSPSMGLVGEVFLLHQLVVARMAELSFNRAQLCLHCLLEIHLPEKLYLGDTSYSDPSHIVAELKWPLLLFPAETAPYSEVMYPCRKIATAKEELRLFRQMNELYQCMDRPLRPQCFFEHDRPIDLYSLMQRWYHDESSLTPQQYRPIYSGGSSSWMGQNIPAYYF